MPEKHKLTLEEHQQLASALSDAKRSLCNVLPLFEKALPKTHRAHRLLAKLIFTGGYLGQLRSALDSQFYRDFPGYPVSDDPPDSPYYPTHREEPT